MMMIITDVCTISDGVQADGGQFPSHPHPKTPQKDNLLRTSALYSQIYNSNPNDLD